MGDLARSTMRLGDLARGMRVHASAERVALCVGNAAYTSSPLRNAANDARDVGAALKTIGFKVTLLLDASLEQMLDAVEEFGAALRPGGMGMFFFAGHGCQSDDGTNYLIPVEEVPKDTYLRSRALAVQDVLNRMERSGAHFNMLILDACRSKPSRMERSARSAPLGLAEMRAPAGSVIAFACAPGKTALDGDGANGVFTSHLLRHLTQPGLDVDELLRVVSGGVYEETRKAQDPFHSHNLKVRRVCLVDAPPPTHAAPAPAPAAASAPAVLHHSSSAAAVQLAAFLAHCDLFADAPSLGPKLDAAGVHKESDLQYMDAETIASLGVSPVIGKKLKAGLASYKPGGGSAPSTPSAAATAATTASGTSVVDSLAAAEERGDWAAIVAAMRAAPGDGAVQEAAAGALLNGTANNAPAKLAAGTAGAVAALADALRAHAAARDVALNTAWALATLSSEAPNAVRAVDAGVMELLLDAAKRHAGDAQVAQFAALALSRVLADKPEAKARAGAAGAVDVLLAALKKHGADAGVAEQTLAAMVALVSEDDNVARAVRAGVVEAAVAAMKALPAESGVQVPGCRTLLRISARAEGKERVLKAGAVEVLLAALKAHPNDVSVQEHGCWALSRVIGDNADAKKRAANAGAVAAALAALRTHGGSDIDVKENALLVLSSLSTEDALVPSLRDAGVVADVAAAMCSEPRRDLVFSVAARTLTMLSFNHAPTKVGISDAGVVEETLQALASTRDVDTKSRCAALVAQLVSEAPAAKRFNAVGGMAVMVAAARAGAAAGNGSLQAFALNAVGRASADNVAAKTAAGDAGAVEAALDALQGGTLDDDGEAEKCLFGLSTILSERPNAARAAARGALPLLCAAAARARERGGVDALVHSCTAMMRIAINVAVSAKDASAALAVMLDVTKVHPRDAKVQSRGLLALAQFTSGCRQHGTPALELGTAGVDVALVALRTHSRDTDIVENALLVLRVAAAEEPITGSVLDAMGAIKAVVAAQKAMPAAALVQTSAARVISNACTNDVPGRTACGAAGAMDTLVAALKAHRGADRVAEEVAIAIGNMLGLEANVTRAAKAGAADQLVAVMKAHPGNAEVQEHGCKSFARLCATAEGRTHATRAGAVAVARDAQNRFAAGSGVADMAQRALTALA